MKRYTFVVHVHPDGIPTLENLSTHERVRIVDLAWIGVHIEHWLDAQTRAHDPGNQPSDLAPPAAS